MSKISNPFSAGAFSTTSGFGSSLAISPISHVGEPLDLSGIADSSIQIPLKNLSKKEHENTKVKALEDLTNAIENPPGGQIEEGVLSAWMQLYPRLSVDPSRRVRLLTHTLHATICCANKKRIAKFMPQISGPWLCGTYDNDRTVAKTARESLIKTFTLDKLKKVWEVYHSDILSYCTNIIEREQVYTLSSETQVKNAEEAEAKFARVIGACISAIRHLLMDIPQEGISKEDASYQEFFGKPRLWEFAYHSDPNLRSSVYNLLRACLKKHRGYVEPIQNVVAKNIITKSFPISQLGSVSDYLDTLIELTEAYPQIWLQVKGKKTNRTISLLGQFISQGPQGAQPDFWAKVNSLIDLLPEEVIPHDRQAIEDLLDAYTHGINGPTVARTHAILSWTSYFGVCRKLLSLKELPTEVNQMIVNSRIIPVYEGYLLQQETSKFKITGQLATTACVNGLLRLSPEKNVAISDSRDSISKTNGLEATYLLLWDRLEEIVFSRVKTEESSSEISPEVLSVGTRWLELLSEFYKLLPDDSLNAQKLIQSIRKLVKISLENLERHKDGISMFASLFEKAVIISPASIWKDSELHLATEDFFSAQLPNLHPSPLASVILKAMLHWFKFADSADTIEALWTENLNALLSSQEENKAETIGAILRDFPPELRGKVPSIPELGTYVMDRARKAVGDDSDTDAWSFTITALKTQGTLIPESATTQILEMITEQVTGLDSQSLQDSGLLTKLEFIAQNYLHSLVGFVQSSSNGRLLLFHLLRLEGLDPDQNNSIVKRINGLIEGGALVPGSSQDVRELTLTMAKIIEEAVLGHEENGRNSIPVDFLASKALHYFHHAHGEEKLSIVLALTFPDSSWSVQDVGDKVPLKLLLEKPPRVGVDLTNPLGGCVNLVETDQDTATVDNNFVDDHAQRLLRVAIYSLKLIQDPIFFGFLDKNTRILTIFKLLLTAEWSKDNLTILGQDIHWRSVVSQFVSQTQALMAEQLKSHHGFFSENGHDDVDLLGQKLMEISRGRSALAFYGARVLYWLLSELVEIHGCSQKTAEGFIENRGIRNTQDIFLAVSLLLALSRPLRKSKLTENLLSSLASDVSGIPVEKIPQGKVPPKLVLLNSLMSESIDETINFPTQRAMFVLRNVLTWFDLDEAIDTREEIEINEALVSETAKLLRNIVPIVKDVYGSHWKTLCNLVLIGWMYSSNMFSATYWCMKLFEALKSNCAGNDNDDFENAVNDNDKQFNKVLIKMFESVQGPTEDPSAGICYILLSRLVKNIPIAEFESMDGIYPLLRGMPTSIHETAYEILHQYIPLEQEKISIEAALAGEDDEFSPQLPLELLSLVLETPSAELLEDLVLDAKPLGESTEESIRGCFLAWRLIFDHFEKATFKVKSAYTLNLQEGGYLENLLDLTFEFLGISRGRTFDPDREQIKHFPIDSEDWTSSKSTKQLLVHLYYLSLLTTPSLVKSWFIAQTNRQISNGVEGFTEKFISPLIIDAELTSVSSWAAGELPASSSAAGGGSSDIEIQVRVSRAVREVTINCPIDDQVMEILIRLPPSFPLHKPELSGTKKVGFTEVQWKAIQLASHAVIALQGGSIIDAVMLFRKNVTLHFAGVEECAICYSIVGQERTLPEKQCVTCKNKFHGGCLFKWFKTSNSSTCPLCRTQWQFYGRAGGR